MIRVDISKGIKVGGFDYVVDMSNEAHHELRADQDNGQCDLHNQRICLDPDNTPQRLSKTFVHEVIEAVNYVYCDNKIEHEKIQQLSFGLHQVMENLGVQFGKGEGV